MEAMEKQTNKKLQPGIKSMLYHWERGVVQREADGDDRKKMGHLPANGRRKPIFFFRFL